MTIDRLILASTSPRRRELIKALDISVECIGSGAEEPPPDGTESGVEYVLRLSREKAAHAARLRPDDLIIGADTSVVLRDEILGKPASKIEAFDMLNRLRGQEHLVVTGVTLMDGSTGEWRSSHKSSRIFLREYTDSEIESYIATGEPIDKAGAYAVQDEIFRPATKVEGCYLNAIGFPLCEVMKLLQSFGADTKIKPDWKYPSKFEGCSVLKVQGAADA